MKKLEINNIINYIFDKNNYFNIVSFLIKTVLIILFLICLKPNNHYSFYSIVRFIALVGFTILAYITYNNKNNIAVIIYIGLALLFQPYIKLRLDKEIWNTIDLIVAIALFLTIIIKFIPHEKFKIKGN